VLEASNGSEALTLLLDGQIPEPCLILLDLQMPIMSGWELLTIVKRNARLAAVPVIVSSGLPPSSPRRLRQPAVSSWIQKPYDWDRLIPLVRAHARDPVERVPRSHRHSAVQ